MHAAEDVRDGHGLDVIEGKAVVLAICGVA
jgi:hypothetical protein